MKTPITKQIADRLEELAVQWKDHTSQAEALMMAAKEVMTFQEKEKEFTTNFAMDYVFSGNVGCAIWADGPPELDIDKSAKQYYEQTFNTKEK